jgi:hypothetical protein
MNSGDPTPPGAGTLPETPLNLAALLIGGALGLIALAEVAAKRERERLIAGRPGEARMIYVRRLEEHVVELRELAADAQLSEAMTHKRLDACRRALRRHGVTPAEIGELEHDGIAGKAARVSGPPAEPAE